MTIDGDIRSLFRDAGATGFLHARELGGSENEVAVDADAPVVLASVFKIPVAVAYQRAVSAGAIDPTERTTVASRYRRGGVGLAGLRDDAIMTWRDLGHLMLTISDNAATDVVFGRIGQAAVDAVLADLNLGRTRIDGCCEDLFATIADDLGVARDAPDIDAVLASQPEESLWKLAVLDPARTNSSTAREMTALLAAIWSNAAGPPDACARLRATLAQQVWPHRLRSGFPDAVRIAGKTGTLPAIRNEVGVVEYPDGRTFAVAVFTRAHSLADNLPDVDRAIGLAARRAVDSLREVG